MLFFFFNDTSTTEIYTLSLHDALPICIGDNGSGCIGSDARDTASRTLRQTCDRGRSEEHTSELQSPYDLVCRLLLEKKKKKTTRKYTIKNKYDINTSEKSNINHSQTII